MRFLCLHSFLRTPLHAHHPTLLTLSVLCWLLIAIEMNKQTTPCGSIYKLRRFCSWASQSAFVSHFQIMNSIYMGCRMNPESECVYLFEKQTKKNPCLDFHCTIRSILSFKIFLSEIQLYYPFSSPFSLQALPSTLS